MGFGSSAGSAKIWQALEALHGFQQDSLNLGVSRWVLWDLFGLGRFQQDLVGLGRSGRISAGLDESKRVSVSFSGSWPYLSAS